MLGLAAGPAQASTFQPYSAQIGVAQTIHGQAVRIVMHTAPGWRTTFTWEVIPERVGLGMWGGGYPPTFGRVVALNGTAWATVYPYGNPELAWVGVWVGSRLIAQRLEWVY